MIGKRVWIGAVALLAVFVVAMPGDVTAKTKRSRKTLTMTVDGKKLKPTPRTVDFSVGGGTIGLGILGQKIPHLGRGLVRTVYIACATLWPPPALGTPLLGCLGSYSELNTRNPTAAKYWSQFTIDNSTVVIIDAWDGTNVEGHFTSTIPAAITNPGPPPVTLVGTFSGPVRFGDPNR